MAFMDYELEFWGRHDMVGANRLELVGKMGSTNGISVEEKNFGVFSGTDGKSL